MQQATRALPTRETGVGYFLRQYREARQLLAEGKTFTWGKWPGREISTEAQFHAEIASGLDKKINTHGGILAERGDWSKWDSDYQIRLGRDQRAIHERVRNRVIVTQFETKEARERFGHLLTDRRDLD